MVGGRQGCGLNFSSSLTRCFRRSPLFLSVLFLMLFGVNSWAGVGGSVSGTIKDTSNAVVPNATVNATNIETGVQHQAATNGQGFYSFANLQRWTLQHYDPKSGIQTVPADRGHSRRRQRGDG